MSVERAGEVLKALKSSEHPYLPIIYWQCRRETDTNIATNRLNPTVSANYVFQRKKELETAFKTHQVNYPSPEVCEALEKYFTGPPKFDVREAVTPTPIVIEQTSIDPPPPPPQPNQQPDPPTHSQGEQVILPAASQSTKREGCLSLPVLLGALVLLVTGLLIWSWLTDESQPVERIVEVTREIESIVEVTVPPIEVTRIVEVINTVEVPVKETVLSIQTVPPVEVTRIVEVTPLPPTPTPLPQTVTISEDFDDGVIDPSISTLNPPVIVNGILEPPNTLIIGDETWKNYSLSFDWIPLSCGYSGRDNGNLRIRVSGNNYVLYQMPYCAGDNKTWYTVINGTQYESLVVRSGSPMRIEVKDDQVTQTTPDGETHQFINTTAVSGGISLNLNYAQVDNFVITRND